MHAAVVRLCPLAFVAKTYAAATPQKSRNKDEAAWVDAQVERFVATIATAAANKQNHKDNPSAVTATAVAVVVKQIVEHILLPPEINEIF